MDGPPRRGMRGGPAFVVAATEDRLSLPPKLGTGE